MVPAVPPCFDGARDVIDARVVSVTKVPFDDPRFGGPGGETSRRSGDVAGLLSEQFLGCSVGCVAVCLCRLNVSNSKPSAFLADSGEDLRPLGFGPSRDDSFLQLRCFAVAAHRGVHPDVERILFDCHV